MKKTQEQSPNKARRKPNQIFINQTWHRSDKHKKTRIKRIRELDYELNVYLRVFMMRVNTQIRIDRK